MDAMFKNTFEIMTDPDTGVRYVTKAIDEETKNHKETDQDIISGFMPENKDSKYCPVKSYLRYLNALSPRSEKLWQTPKFEEFPTDGSTVFYYGKMGHNKIDSFVGEVCDLVGTQKRYTNHCLRVTAVTNLSRQNFNNKQIMSITGHKSSASLEIYQKVNPSEKLEMGHTLANALTNPNPQKRSSTSTNTCENDENAAPPAKMQVVSIPTENDPDFPNFSPQDILQIVEQCEKASEEYAVTNVNNNNNNQVTMNNQLVQQRSPNIPGFNNCKIGNITINIQKWTEESHHEYWQKINIHTVNVHLKLFFLFQISSNIPKYYIYLLQITYIYIQV